jgi:hypothetical protein
VKDFAVVGQGGGVLRKNLLLASHWYGRIPPICSIICVKNLFQFSSFWHKKMRWSLSEAKIVAANNVLKRTWITLLH